MAGKEKQIAEKIFKPRVRIRANTGEQLPIPKSKGPNFNQPPDLDIELDEMPVSLQQKEKKGLNTTQKVGAGIAGAGLAGKLFLGGDEAKPVELPAIEQPTGERDSEPSRKDEMGEVKKEMEQFEFKPKQTPKQYVEDADKHKFDQTIDYTIADLEEADNTALAEALQEYKSAINEANAAYAAEKDSLAKRELWEKIINAVGLMSAGLYGLKTGLDMSGAKFDVSDWAEKRKAVAQDLRDSAAIAKDTLGMQMQLTDLSERRNQALWQRAKDQAEARGMTAKAAAELHNQAQKNAMEREQLWQNQNQFWTKINQQQAQFAQEMVLKRKQLEVMLADADTKEKKLKAEQVQSQIEKADKLQSALTELYVKMGDPKTQPEQKEALNYEATRLEQQLMSLTGAKSPATYEQSGDTITARPVKDIIQEKVSSRIQGDLEPKIQQFMRANNITDRDEAIKLLKDNKVIP